MRQKSSKNSTYWTFWTDALLFMLNIAHFARINLVWRAVNLTYSPMCCQNACTIGINNASHLPQLDHYHRVPRSPRLRISTQSQLGWTTVQCIYTKHPNHSWKNDYDRGCTKNTLTALYTTDQQHVLIGSTYLPRNNHRRKGRRCTNQISLYGLVVRTFHGTITVGKVTE